MDMYLARRCRRAALTLVSTALLSISLTSPAGSTSNYMTFFMGGGFGPTPEVAIQSAYWDAVFSASDLQFYSCQMVGVPQIFPGPNPARRRNFTAQVMVGCIP